MTEPKVVEISARIHTHHPIPIEKAIVKDGWTTFTGKVKLGR
jgi:hypothetical protein